MKIIKISAAVILLLITVSLIFLFTVVPVMVAKSMNQVTPHEPMSISEEAQEFHDSLVIGDLHADTTLWKRNILKRADYGHVDVPRMQEGNQAFQIFTTVTKTPKDMNYESNSVSSDNITLLAIVQLWPLKSWNSLKERALYQANRLHKAEKQAPTEFMVVETKADLAGLINARANGSTLVGGLIGTEGSHALEGKLENIDVLYQAGFRMMSLHHFFDNKLGGSLHGTSKAGLTTFGKDVVTKIDAMPILLDVSHSSEQVVREVLRLTKNPLVVSHTGTYGHCNSPRNIDDELMIQIAQKGGLIGVGYWDAICDISPAGVAKAIVAAVNLVGEDHVALGSDFDGAVTTTFDSSELAILTAELLDTDLSKTAIRKIMGENLANLLLARLPTE